MTGGVGGSRAESSAMVWALDLSKNSWHGLADMHYARFSHGSYSMGANTFVFCGKSKDGYSGVIEVLRIDIDFDIEKQVERPWS